MKTDCCAAFVSAAAVFLLTTGRATAAPPGPLLGPTLTYSLVTLPQPTPGLETIEFGLSGYVFSPAGLAALTPAQVSRYTIISFGETGFESQGGVVDFAYGITPASDPLPPLNFLVGVATPLPTVNGQAVQLFNQPFTLTNQDGTTETVFATPYAAPSVPEPSPLALLVLGLAPLPLVAARRLRRRPL